MLAPLAETNMFENRINGFVPNMGLPTFTPGVFPQPQAKDAASQSPMAIQVAAIYQAAAQRAIEEHEIDKLFNAQFYDDFQI
jgi:hypothetical protein